ncbi:glycosyltransferase family 4 protein [Candidatus Falkowbacteria bacterium]|nr:glycosyltransferase family 4 protein [Candidatus Falkowbacteria bacterium]
MKIVIDARLYGASKNRGLGRYVEQLVKNLEKVDHENDYTVLLRQENFDDYEPQNSRFKKVLADYPWYSFAEQILLPWKLWRMDCDLVHFPHFNVPIFCPRKFVVTIHDLIMYKFPNDKATTRNKFFYRTKYWLHKFVIKSAIRKAKKIIVDCEFTKRDVIREFGVGEDRVRVIYLGFEVGDKGMRDANYTNVLEKYGIKGQYLLYVGSAYPHKNLETLINAFDRVKKEHGDLQLVLVGRRDYFYEKLKTRDVVFTGDVSNGDLAALYRNALIYVFPSLYEGFGLPGLEAMSYGVPVIAARASCLPEIYGEAALYFEPKSGSDLAGKIGQILESSDLRENLAARGYDQIKKYSWESCAVQTKETYAHLRKDEGGV